MRTKWNLISRRFLTVSATLGLLLTGSHAFAVSSATATASLTVTATVTSSIQLLLDSDTSGVALTGTGTNTATLAFGNLSTYGTAPANVTVSPTSTLCSNCFQASTPVKFVVNAADTTAANGFTLTGSVSAPGHGEVLAVGNSGALSTSAATPTTITATGTYGSTGNSLNVILAIPTATADTTALSDTISLTATAN